MPVAFAGTVTSVEGDTVSLEVAHWYRGGTAQRVTLTSKGSAALYGIDLHEGAHVLLSAKDGVVTVCGLSGPATPELQQAYTEAYGR